MIYESGILTQNGVKERQTRELQNVADTSSFVIITLMKIYSISDSINHILYWFQYTPRGTFSALR